MDVMFRTAFIWSSLALCVISQTCQSGVPEDQRRDCYMWAGGNQAVCEARGCVWCETQTVGVPWCFIDDEVCPSSIPEVSRADCHPEPGVTRDACTTRGCMWCPTTSGGIPWCFSDPDMSHGGKVCPAITDEDRVDCFPVDGVTEDNCMNKGCYWCASAVPNTPFCFTSENIGYKMVAPPVPTTKGYQVELQRVNFPSWFGESVDSVMVDVEFQENERLRVKMYDPAVSRYEVPVFIPSPATAAPSPLYDIQFTDDPAFSFRVIRLSNGEILYDSALGGFQFEDQFLQIAGRLPTANVYGFGETEHHTLRHDMNWRKWGMWARDEPVTQANIYGVHPFMTGLDTNNQGYGILILNSNAQEIELTPAPGLVYRTTGGILDMYFFLGPTPENVVEQYTAAIGRPAMPPYWMLGFQLSRYGYNTLQNMSGVVDRMRQYDIPHDVQHGDIDTFERKLSFTYDSENFAGLPQYIQQLKAEGTRYITILDPFISTGETGYGPFDRGQAANVWMTESDGVTPAISTCWPDDPVYYPDFSKQAARDWWVNECTVLHAVIEFDGLWVDMNEPASFSEGSLTGCGDNEINYPLFKPRSMWGQLPEKTLCPDYLSEFGNHYNTHSLYGWSCGLPSRDAAAVATGKRSYAVIRSTFPGLGQYGGHWLGDNAADWTDLAYSIIGSLEFNMFGIPYVGADICGYFGDSYPELCMRWMQLGAFYTFSRSHNGFGWAEHDPGRWPDVAAVSRDVLHIRYTLLPYLYTLFYEAHVYGRTVMRPVHHEFPDEVPTHDISFQLMWGSGLLITPVVTQDATTVTGYFPDARWYNYYDGVEEPTRAGFTTLPAPVEIIPLYFRGGHVFPTQQPGNSTMFTRSLPMGLIVTLDDANAASGTLFWDEGDTPDTYENGEYFLATYTVAAGSLVGSIVTDGYPGVADLVFESVRVYGHTTTVSTVTVNGGSWSNFTYDPATNVLNIFGLNIGVGSDFTVQWS